MNTAMTYYEYSFRIDGHDDPFMVVFPISDVLTENPDAMRQSQVMAFEVACKESGDALPVPIGVRPLAADEGPA
jgi:hypothetical protein